MSASARSVETTRSEADAAIDEAVATHRHMKIAFANAHLVNVAAADEALRAALEEFTVLPDGVGVDLASRILHGARFPDNLNGTDFTPRYLARASRALKVGLLGARPGVAQAAAGALAAHAPRHRYTVFGDGFFSEEKEAAILRHLEAARPDILLVAFGNPRQELWIAQRLDQRHCSAALGVGALFDFLAGEVSRAPDWVRAARLEWVWRLALEPGRLWRRYVLGNPVFLARVAMQKLRGAP